MDGKMTVISAAMYDKAVNGKMNVKEAVNMLRECTQFRSLSAKLGAFAKGRDIRKLLTEGLCNNHPEAKHDSVDKKVRNWLADRQTGIQKADAIELCFILGLQIDESEHFLAMISEEGFHWRDPDEIPYIYALMHGMNYIQAKVLAEKINCALKEKEVTEEDSETFTAVIHERIKNISSEEELTEYVISEASWLGKMHNTAYSLFTEMMEKLEAPEVYGGDDDYFPENEKYSVGRIVATYMHREDIPENTDNKKKTLYSALQKSVSANWPDESVLSRIKNRRADISRKTLILLFLATYDEGEIADEDEYFENEEEKEKSRDEIFMEFYMSMNTMLSSCGFSTLDPRNPFDWMIIFCMGADDFWATDSTLSEFLQTLFSEKDIGNTLQNG